jgi:hypothetical protein
MGEGGVAKTEYFSKKNLTLKAITSLAIFGLGSPYNMHIYTM